MPAKVRPGARSATLVSLPLTLAFVIVAFIAMGGVQAAADLSCGDTITADATLHRNLLNCPNNGIIIGADNITLDLNYHRIDGDGTPAAGLRSHGRSSVTLGCSMTATTASPWRTARCASSTSVHPSLGPAKTACWIFPRQSSASSGSLSPTRPEAWSATVRGAATPPPTGTGWACSPHIACGSLTARSGTTPSRASTLRSIPTTT